MSKRGGRGKFSKQINKQIGLLKSSSSHTYVLHYVWE